MAYGLAFTGITLFTYLIVGALALAVGTAARVWAWRQHRRQAIAAAKRRHPANRGRGER